MLIITIFGITGDLVRRKLIPSLYNLYTENRLPRYFMILGVARRSFVIEDCKKFISNVQPSSQHWEEFTKHFLHITGDAHNPQTYADISQIVSGLHKTHHCQSVLYYLAVAPILYPVIATHLHAAKLTRGCKKHKSFSRVIIEKPFGTDLASAHALNTILRRCFAEGQIYRIDHYLGKETVQNLLTFRFANDIFTPLWNAKGIDHIQITAFETLGIENRGAYYDSTGALKDMVQNHMLQLLAHIAMEEPNAFASRPVRKERIQILQNLKTPSVQDVAARTVRGQYAPYRSEPRIAPASPTETFTALKLFIANDRWKSVPFYLRTGKRLKEQYTEIAMQFKERSPHLFHGYPGDEPNALVFRIQPDEAITIRFTIKEPGFTQKVRTVDNTLCYSNTFAARPTEAYERLILDAIQGDQTLFTHTDEVEAQWKFISPIADAWQEKNSPQLEMYDAGSWGPKAADKLIERDGRTWIPYKPGICTPFGTRIPGNPKFQDPNSKQ